MSTTRRSTICFWKGNVTTEDVIRDCFEDQEMNRWLGLKGAMRCIKDEPTDGMEGVKMYNIDDTGRVFQ